MGTAKSLAAAVLIFWLFLASIGVGQSFTLSPGSWHTFTSTGDVRRIVQVDDTLFLATAGGLVERIGSATYVHTNVVGLGTTDIHDIVSDVSGSFWIAGFGRLIHWSGDVPKTYLFFDNDNALFALYRVVDDGDNLWLGTSLGLVLFSKTIDGGQIQDSYGLFGSLNPSPSVYDIWLNGDSIWIATSVGLAVADKSTPNDLKSPAAWTTFSIDNFPVLATDTIRRVVPFEFDLYLATPEGPFRLHRASDDTTISAVPFGAGGNCADLRVDNDSLFLYSDSGLGCLKNDVVTSVATPGLTGALATGYNNGLYRLATRKAGGIYSNQDGTFANLYPNELPDNRITGITVSPDGTMTALVFAKGASTLKDYQFINRTMSLFRATTVAASDTSNVVWAGSEGDGIYRITDGSLTKYTNTNSTLRGVSENPAYVVVRGVAVDDRHLFASCYRALTGYPVAIATLDSVTNLASWDSLGTLDGITNAFTGSIARWGDYLAVATESNGLFRYYTGPDIGDRSDDSVFHMRESNFYLRSDAVRVVKYSPLGELWVGTNFGLSRLDPGLGLHGLFVDEDLPGGIGPDITALEFDTRGNLFIGTHNGLARRDAVTGDYTVYTQLTSGLISDDITALALDRTNGVLWIATPAGISAFGVAIVRPTDDPEEVICYPNPYEIRTGEELLNFNFAGSFDLRIFTTAGELVRQTPLTYWDGRNEAGEIVSSGVYLYVLNGLDGSVARGKLLLIRR